MTQYDPQQSFKVRDDLVVEQIEEQALILDMSRNVYFSLNPMAVIMFDGLRRGLSLEAVCREVEALYDAPEDVIFGDLTAFVNELAERDLLREVS